MSSGMERMGLSYVLLSWAVILLFYLCQVISGVKVLNVTVLSDTNNNTYLFRDDRGVIFCDFELGETEVLEAINWSKKKGEITEIFYVWRKDRRSNQPKGAFKGRIDMKERNPRKLVITTADIEMHGVIQCEVKTNESSERGETTLVVVQNTCHKSDWKFMLDKETCTETVHFSCTRFFPKPSVSCGLYNKDPPRYLNSLPMDSITERRDNTFDLSSTRNFNASHFIHEGNVVLRCDIIVYGSPYKFTLEREMFGEKGCSTEYLPEDVNATSINETCWKMPATGSVVLYRCDSSELLKTVRCFNGTWIDESDGVVSDHLCPSESPALYEVRSHLLALLGAAALMFFLW